MTDFLLHRRGQILQFLDIVLTRTDIAFKLLDFIVQNEFELFELLGLLFQLVDICLLVLHGLFAFLQLGFV